LAKNYIVCTILDNTNMCLNLTGEPNVLHLSITHSQSSSNKNPIAAQAMDKI